MNSCLYHGVHCAIVGLQPKAHRIVYSVFMAWLDLDELDALPLCRACVVTALRPRHFMMRITRWARRSKRVSWAIWKI
ncbi:hypothetical protein MJK72_03915 [Klebsiella pneumoniae]|nr:hypothetical protein MJK72_03915 [Klebsiella pneumoniae]